MDRTAPTVWVNAYDMCYQFTVSQITKSFMLHDAYVHWLRQYKSKECPIVLTKLPTLKVRGGAWYFGLIHGYVHDPDTIPEAHRCWPADMKHELLVLIKYLQLDELLRKLDDTIDSIPDTSSVYMRTNTVGVHILSFNTDMTGRLLTVPSSGGAVFENFAYSTNLDEDTEHAEIRFTDWSNTVDLESHMNVITADVMEGSFQWVRQSASSVFLPPPK